MINANELRIGNYVTYHGEEDMPCCLDAQDIVNIFNKYMGNDEIHSPILLTPEILEQCGFKFNQELNGWELKGWLPFHIHSMNGIYDNDMYCLTTFKKDWKIGKFQYLHQLQNLYFALTGEELTIKDL
jgi:hypothetical protein